MFRRVRLVPEPTPSALWPLIPLDLLLEGVAAFFSLAAEAIVVLFLTSLDGMVNTVPSS